jgi:general stress protein 26
MAKPTPQNLDPDAVPDLARAAIKAARFPMLATLDGHQPRVRPVSPVLVEDFTVYVANLRSYHKTAEIAANPNVELCYMDGDHNQVRITGTAIVLTDAAKIDAIWKSNPLLRSFLGSPDNPELVIYCIQPLRVRYMQEWALNYHEVPV